MRGKAAGGSGGDGSRAGGLGTDAGAHGAVFTFHRDKFCVHLTIGHKTGEILRNLRGRSDRIRRHNVRVDLTHGGGYCLIS